jgi:hypothetical protein
MADNQDINQVKPVLSMFSWGIMLIIFSVIWFMAYFLTNIESAVEAKWLNPTIPSVLLLAGIILLGFQNIRDELITIIKKLDDKREN